MVNISWRWVSREAPSLNVGSVWFCIFVFVYLCIYFLGCVCVRGGGRGGGVEREMERRLSVLCWLVCAPPICHQCHLAKNEMWAREVGFACLTWLYGLFVRTLISRTNACAGCCRPTLKKFWAFCLGALRSNSEVTSPRVSWALADLYVELFRMNVNLKVFCILSLLIILCATSKASEMLFLC